MTNLLHRFLSGQMLNQLEAPAGRPGIPAFAEGLLQALNNAFDLKGIVLYARREIFFTICQES